MSKIICRPVAGVIFFLGIIFSACLPQKGITYFQSADTSHKNFPVDVSNRPVIQKNDILSIYVSSVSEEASKIFNYEQELTSGHTSANTYVVDANGDIQLPLVGNIKVESLTPLEARDLVKARLEKYLTNPTVKLNLVNFSVTVLGEVTKPGVYTVANEKITLTEALAMAGDLTVFGKRTNVMVIREVNGKKEFAKVDLTSRELFSSPYYNLHGNDIIYVEPISQKKFTAQTYYRVLPLFLSGISLVVVLLSLSKD